MAATFLRLPNVVHMQERLLRLWYMRHGLRLLDVQVDDETTIACWAPRHYANSLALSQSQSQTLSQQSQSLNGHHAGRIDPKPVPANNFSRMTSSPQRPAKQPLLMLHGFGASATWQWTNQVAAFSREFDLLLPDLIFFGGSSSSSQQRTEGFQAAAMLRLLDRLGIDECSLVGLSYGGFVAYRMASLQPERVQRLVLAASGLMTSAEEHSEVLREWGVGHVAQLLLPDEPMGVQRLMQLAYAEDAPSLPAWVLRSAHEALFDNQEEKRGLLDAVLKYLAQTTLNDGDGDEQGQEGQQQGGERQLQGHGEREWREGERLGAGECRGDVSQAAQGSSKGSGVDQLPDLNALNIPAPEMETLLLWGSRDSIFPLSVAHRMHSHFGPIASLEVLDGATHALNIHRPQPFNDAVMSFLRAENNVDSLS